MKFVVALRHCILIDLGLQFGQFCLKSRHVPSKEVLDPFEPRNIAVDNTSIHDAAPNSSKKRDHADVASQIIRLSLTIALGTVLTSRFRNASLNVNETYGEILTFLSEKQPYPSIPADRINSLYEAI